MNSVPNETVYLTRRKSAEKTRRVKTWSAEEAEGRGLAPSAFREDHAMPRRAVEDHRRMSLRIRAEAKAFVLGAVARNHPDWRDFVIGPAVRAAKAVIEEADHV